MVVEGEKATDALTGRGIAAVATVGGAASTPGDDALRPLRRLAPVLWPDADAPGRAHMGRVGAALRRLGCADVLGVDWPDAPPRGDAADFTGSDDELKALLDGAGPYETPPPADGAASSESAGNDGGTPLFATPVLVRLADVEPESVQWLWPGRIPLGKLTLLVGEPGVGKSTILLDIAARLSRGSPLPDSATGPQGQVLLMTAEDDLPDTVRPRLENLGADAGRVVALTMMRGPDGDRMFNLETDLPALERALTPETRLIIIDPVLAYTGGRDTHVSAEVRGLLAPLAAMAGRAAVAVAGVIHLNKRQGSSPLHRVLGAIDFVAAARSVLLAADDPDDPAKRHLAVVKCNLAALAPTLGYHFTDGMLFWDGASEKTARQLVAAATDDGERDAQVVAEAFLLEALADGPATAKQLRGEARENGIADRTLDRAKVALGVRAERVGERQRQGGGQWFWRLRAQGDVKDAKSANLGDVASLTQSVSEAASAGAELGVLNPGDGAEPLPDTCAICGAPAEGYTPAGETRCFAHYVRPSDGPLVRFAVQELGLPILARQRPVDGGDAS